MCVCVCVYIHTWECKSRHIAITIRKKKKKKKKKKKPKTYSWLQNGVHFCWLIVNIQNYLKDELCVNNNSNNPRPKKTRHQKYFFNNHWIHYHCILYIQPYLQFSRPPLSQFIYLAWERNIDCCWALLLKNKVLLISIYIYEKFIIYSIVFP